MSNCKWYNWVKLEFWREEYRYRGGRERNLLKIIVLFVKILRKNVIG
jgi:hypothetical protein